MMKKLLGILSFLMVGVCGFSQAVYIPSKGSPTAKPISPSAGVPLDGRSYFYDSLNFRWRPFLSTSEVLSFMPVSLRKGHFPVIVNTGGSLSNGVITGGVNTEYWFKDGTTNSDLVLKNSPGSFSAMTRAQLRLINNSKTNDVVLTTDFGGGNWLCKGLSDGTKEDDGILTLISADGRYWERQFDVNRINAAWFGAIAGDGLDDSPAINAALRYAKRRKKREQVEIPEGNLNAATNIYMDSSFAYLVGQGRDASTVIFGANARLIVRADTANEYVYRAGIENFSINAPLSPYCYETYMTSEFAVQNVAVAGATVANYFSDFSDIIHLDQYVSSNTKTHLLLRGCGHITATHTNFWNADNVILASGLSAVVNLEITANWFENFSTFLKFGNTGETEASVGTVVVSGRFLSTRTDATILDIKPGTAVTAESIIINGSIGLPTSTRGVFSFENKTNTNGFFRLRSNANITSSPNVAGIFKRSDSSYTGNLWLFSDRIENSAFVPMFAGGAFDIAGWYGVNNLNYVPSGIIFGTDYNNGRVQFQNNRLHVSIAGQMLPIPMFSDTITASNRIDYATYLASRWAGVNTTDIAFPFKVGIGPNYAIDPNAALNIEVTALTNGFRVFSLYGDPAITLEVGVHKWQNYLNNLNGDYGLFHVSRGVFPLWIRGADGHADFASTVSAARAVNSTDLLRKDQFDEAAFTLRSALGSGYSLFNSPTANTGIVKQINFLGTNYPVATLSGDTVLNLDFSDFAHLSGTQTFTGAKTFSAATYLAGQPVITATLSASTVPANFTILTRDNSSFNVQQLAANAFLNTLTVLPEYSGNSVAVDNGLTNGQFYRTGDVVKQVHP